MNSYRQRLTYTYIERFTVSITRIFVYSTKLLNGITTRKLVMNNESVGTAGECRYRPPPPSRFGRNDIDESSALDRLVRITKTKKKKKINRRSGPNELIDVRGVSRKPGQKRTGRSAGGAGRRRERPSAVFSSGFCDASAGGRRIIGWARIRNVLRFDGGGVTGVAKNTGLPTDRGAPLPDPRPDVTVMLAPRARTGKRKNPSAA